MLGAQRIAHLLVGQAVFLLWVGQAQLGEALLVVELLVSRVVLARLVVGPEGVDRVDQPQAALHLRHVGGHLLLLDRHHQRLRPPAQRLRRAGRAFAQQVAKALAPRDLPGQRDHRGGVAPGQVEAARVLWADQPRVEAVEGPGDRRPAGDGIHPVLVANLIRGGDGLQVVDPAVGAEGRQRLVFRAAVARLGQEVTLAHLDHALAAHRAGVAGVAPLEDGVGHPLPADRLRPVEHAAGPVAGGQAAALLLDQHRLGGAVQAHRVNIRIGEVPRPPAGQLVQPLLIGQRRAVFAPHRNRLEVLRSHHRAHAGTPVGAVAHAHDRGEAHALLARRADLEHFDLLVAQLRLERVLCLARDLAPQVRGVAQLGLAVVNPQVDWTRRPPLDHDRVEPGELHLGGEEPARLRIAHRASQRGAGDRRQAALAGDRRAGQHTQGEGEHVLRAERVDSG